ncbi:TetR family transcriptional regulator [Streptomyces sp. NPDC059477]|uniref:TetR family transcriptional regulator n=1 Tax=Streptomyces sp. NPDC059477 TaxID=3346847 RepID=UPI0036B56082
MAWDVEGTKRRIHEAALAEFARYGPSGTTIDRIAKGAGVNRERVYNYFGDKEALFATVVRRELDSLAADVPLQHVTGAEDLAEFAGRAFDYQQDRPDVARLVLWEGLADTGSVPGEADRTALYTGKVRAVEAAQRAGLVDDSLAPAHLVFLLIALTGYWSAVPQMARMLSAEDTGGRDSRAHRRDAVVRAARQLATPGDPGAAAAGRE